MLTINFYDVEISIAEGVEEIVRDPNPSPEGALKMRVLSSTLTLHDS